MMNTNLTINGFNTNHFTIHLDDDGADVTLNDETTTYGPATGRALVQCIINAAQDMDATRSLNDMPEWNSFDCPIDLSQDGNVLIITDPNGDEHHLDLENLTVRTSAK